MVFVQCSTVRLIIHYFILNTTLVLYIGNNPTTLRYRTVNHVPTNREYANTCANMYATEYTVSALTIVLVSQALTISSYYITALNISVKVLHRVNYRIPVITGIIYNRILYT